MLVVSDHGAGPLHGVVNLNAWLASEGFLAYATGGGVAGRKLLGEALQLRRYLPERLRNAAKQRLPALRERAIERGDYTVLDWEQTQAFSYGTFGNIVLNVRGREEHGIVEPGEEYERVRDEIAARLLELRGPGGERIVAQAHRREDLFHGPELAKVPDLLVEFDRYAWLGKGNLKARSDSLWDSIEIEGGGEQSYVGSHRHEGIVVLAGPAVAPGAPVGGELVDVAPTMLYLLGEPIPSDLEGRILMEALRPGAPRRAPARLRRRGSRRVRAEACRARGGGRRRGRAPPARARLPRVAAGSFRKSLTARFFRCMCTCCVQARTDVRRPLRLTGAPDPLVGSPTVAVAQRLSAFLVVTVLAVVAASQATAAPTESGSAATGTTSAAAIFPTLTREQVAAQVAGATMARSNRGFSCKRPLDEIARDLGGTLPLLVRIRFTRYVAIDPGVIQIRRGCRGDGDPNTIDLILGVSGNGRTVGGTSDAIKIREDPHDIQITGYANCGPQGVGRDRRPDTRDDPHQDGAQIQGGRNIHFIDFTWGKWAKRRSTCQGAAGTFVPGQRERLARREHGLHPLPERVVQPRHAHQPLEGNGRPGLRLALGQPEGAAGSSRQWPDGTLQLRLAAVPDPSGRVERERHLRPVLRPLAVQRQPQTALAGLPSPFGGS